MAMGAVSDSSLFWKSWSYQIRHFFRLSDPNLQKLIQNVQRLSLHQLRSSEASAVSNSAPADLYLALSYLSEYSHPELERIFNNIFDKSASTDQLEKALTYLAELCVEHSDEKAFEVCQRIISDCPMKVITKCNIDIQKRMQRLNHHFPPKVVIQEHVPQPSWIQKIFSILGMARFIPYNIYMTLKRGYRVELPSSTSAAQNQILFYKGAYSELQWVETSMTKWFSSRRQALIVTSFTCLLLLTSYNFYKTLQQRYPAFFTTLSEFFKSLIPETLPENQYRDLTEAAKKGLITPSVGRRAVLKIIEACLSPTEHLLPRAVIITGHAGVGKTNVVDDLALRISQGETACLNEKKLFTINGAKLTAKGKLNDDYEYVAPFQEFLLKIKGREDDYILFIDEAHNLNKTTLEELKTLLLTTRLRIIFATTKKELQKTWIQDDALLSRCRKINIDGLENEYRYYILQKSISKYNADPSHPIPINPSIIGSIIVEIDRIHLSGAEPRKSKNFLEDLIRMLNADCPEEPPLLGFLQQKYDELRGKIAYEKKSNRAFTLGESFDSNFEALDLLEPRIQRLKKHHNNRVALFQRRAELLELASKLDQQVEQLEQKIASTQMEKELASLENQFLFLIRFAFKQITQEITQLEIALRQGLPSAELQIEELVSKKLIKQEEADQYKMPEKEKFLTTITSEMIEEHAKRLKEEETATHRIKTGQGSSTNVATAHLPASSHTTPRLFHSGQLPSRTSSDQPFEPVQLIQAPSAPSKSTLEHYEVIRLLHQNLSLIQAILANSRPTDAPSDSLEVDSDAHLASQHNAVLPKDALSQVGGTPRSDHPTPAALGTAATGHGRRATGDLLENPGS